HHLMAQKLGFVQPDETVVHLLEELLAQMHASRTDYTLLFRALSEVSLDSNEGAAALRDRFIDRERFDLWLDGYRTHLRARARDDATRRPAMLATNPKYVLRNYLAQVVIEKAEQGDYAEIERLLTVLRAPFDEHPQQARYAETAPAWADNIQVSCSS
ncbi:MAG: protein adenylyltransferase SelO family protein, partial [Pseudomonadota bacterium]